VVVVGATGLAVGLALVALRTTIRRRFAPRDRVPRSPGGRGIRRRRTYQGNRQQSCKDLHLQRKLQILERVRATPAGFVRTYGDVSPGAPRVAGAVLHECHDPSVPWHRIVRADGSLAKGAKQRRLLEQEGVPFRGQRVDMRVARLPAF
jgi:methylated-DNA-protein-cysteine methyltransferase-like protein